MSDAGPRWLSQGISGGLYGVLLSAPARSKTLWRTHRWKAPRIWDVVTLVRCVRKGSLAPRDGVGESWRRLRGATGGVSDQTARPTSRQKMSGVGGLPKSKPSEGSPKRPTSGPGGSWRSQHQTATLLKVGDAVRGYPAPSWKRMFRNQHKRVGRRAWAEVAVDQGANPGAWELVGLEGSRDNKLIAEIGKRHRLFDGLRAFRRLRHEGE